MTRHQSVDHFAKSMRVKLAANAHKGGWSGDTIDSLIARVNEELDEFKAAIVRGAAVEQVEDEAADVANFLMMVCENYAAERKRP